MDGVGAAPEIVGRKSEYAKRSANPVVDEAVTEKGTVTAVVLDHEQAHQEQGSWNGEEQRGPPEAEIIEEPRRSPERGERQRGDRQFGNAAGVARLAIAAEDLRQGTGVDRCNRTAGKRGGEAGR